MMRFKFSAADTLARLQRVRELKLEATRFGRYVGPAGKESKLRDDEINFFVLPPDMRFSLTHRKDPPPFDNPPSDWLRVGRGAATSTPEFETQFRLQLYLSLSVFAP